MRIRVYAYLSLCMPACVCPSLFACPGLLLTWHEPAPDAEEGHQAPGRGIGPGPQHDQERRARLNLGLERLCDSPAEAGFAEREV